ncbi:MAG: sigma 54-interacting transcriptional regulator [Bacillota bacterium]|nr:sigma 54-interacting transcriptional regulator [Bacillota bacterium]
MDKLIEASHKRCLNLGITPENMYSKNILDGEKLEEKCEENKELIKTAAPYISQLYDFVRGSDFFALLCDGEGCILSVIGDEKILSEAKGLKMIPGAYMNEANIGTNAMGLVITGKIPVQMSGKDHFIKAYHKWTCSAAPIKDKNGNIIGIINLTGYINNVHLHTLGMVVAAANAIEKIIEADIYNKNLHIYNKRIENIFNSIIAGILTCDLSGNIIYMNQQIPKMFGLNENEIKKMKVQDLIKNWNEIIERLQKKESIIDEDIYTNEKVKKFQFTVTACPIYDQEMNILEVTIMFYEIKKNRKLAGKILGGQALYTFDKIIGKSENIKEIIEYSKKIADSKSTILITGESGTGKEIFAQAIHNYSNRKGEPFIAVNCGAVPRTLMESEFFGYEEGSFTGAKKGGNAGKFELADGGTIFLDEIGETPLDMQIKLLRVIEEGVINRIGGSKQISVDVRIMAATNRDLKKEVAKGNFRKDLYYRLNVLPLYLPPLRERRDDIPELVNYYISKTCRRLNKHIINLSEDYMEYLKSYDWPGNIRELENVIEYIINSEVIQKNLFNESSREQTRPLNINLNLSLEQMEKEYITKVVKEVDGNMTMASKILNIGRNTLYRKIEKYSIEYSETENNSNLDQN